MTERDGVEVSQGWLEGTEGKRLLPHAPPCHQLAEAVTGRLVALGFINTAVPLATLHQDLPPEAMALNGHYTNAVSRAFYTHDNAIESAYHDLIAWLYRHGAPEDFLFQAQPIVRFHFPVPFPPELRTTTGQPRQIHSDLLGGHPPRMVQVWAALTDCSGTAALQWAPSATSQALLERYRQSLAPDDPPFADSLQHYYGLWDREPTFANEIVRACGPVDMKSGEVLLFDPHCLHGGTENREDSTRVSVDFRLLPLRYEVETAKDASTPTQQRFRRGELFHVKSAGELFG